MNLTQFFCIPAFFASTRKRSLARVRVEHFVHLCWFYKMTIRCFVFMFTMGSKHQFYLPTLTQSSTVSRTGSRSWEHPRLQRQLGPALPAPAPQQGRWVASPRAASAVPARPAAPPMCTHTSLSDAVVPPAQPTDAAALAL